MKGKIGTKEKPLVIKTPPLTLLLIVCALFIKTAQGQIVYTNVIPDTTISVISGAVTYSLDLNNDGTTDFFFDAIQYGGGCGQYTIQISSLAGDSVMKNSQSFPAELGYNTVVDSSGSWSGYSPLLLQCWCPGAPCNVDSWVNDMTSYLGLKFSVGSITYYGWCRAQVHVGSGLGNDFCTIYDYAYNSTPSQLILAGDTGTGPLGIIENAGSSSHFSIVSSNKVISLCLNKNISPFGVITVYNVLGQELKKVNISNTLSEIEMGKCDNGIYFVTLQTKDMIETEKIYLQ